MSLSVCVCVLTEKHAQGRHGKHDTLQPAVAENLDPPRRGFKVLERRLFVYTVCVCVCVGGCVCVCACVWGCAHGWWVGIGMSVYL